MKIAIIGAGFTGLSAAYQLQKQNHEVTIFEKDNRPGGLALGFKEKNWDWTLEEFYHHWFTSDHAVLNLAREINYPVIIKRPKTSVYINNQDYQLDSAFKLLQFSPLPLVDRLRMGAVIAFLRFNPYWKPLEKFKAGTFLQIFMGQKAYQMVWQPQLANKFGQFISDISLAWFWARINKRTPSLAYPRGGFLQFTQTLAEIIEKNGGQIHYNAQIEKINPLPGGKLSISNLEKTKVKNLKLGIYDKIITTLPSFALTKLVPDLPEDYKTKLTSLRGLGAIVIILRLKKQFLTDNTYWLSICDPTSPIMAIVEHTNFMSSKNYNNEHLVYLGNYLPQDHRYFKLTKDQILKEFDPFLHKLNRNYRSSLIGTELFRVPFAQPIIPTNYSKMIPPLQTPIKNLYLANMQQVYPWDRGTNYAVELGQKVARQAAAD